MTFVLRTRREFAVVLLCPWLLVAGCSSPQPVKVPLEAQTRFGKLAPPASIGRYQLQPGQVAVPPALRKHVPPTYPPQLVRADAAPVTVTVRIVIGRQGNVTGIEPANKDQADPRHARFVAAVKRAVSQWRFYPYRVQTRQPDGNVTQVPMPTTLWYAFDFTVEHGKPTVRAKHQ